MTVAENLFENLRLELRRGCLTWRFWRSFARSITATHCARRWPNAAWTLTKARSIRCLRRLETQGLLASEWREEEKRNKRFYRLSSDGEADLRPVARRVADHQRVHRRIINSIL
jgi:PadR family transcriptional regulator, regulatory protein PadR